MSLICSRLQFYVWFYLQDDTDEEEEEQSAELHRSTTETQQTHGLAYQSADGRTVIWLHPDVQVEQLNAAGFQPQITLMEQPTDNAQEATTLNQKEGQDIVAIAGEVIPQEDITVQTSEDTRNLDEMNSNMSSSLIVDSEAQKDEVIVTNSGQVCQLVNCVTVGEEFQEKSVINSNPKVSHVNRSPSTFTVSSSPQKVMVTHASSSHKSKKKFPKKKCRHSSDNEDSSQSKPSKNGHHKSDSQAEESTSKARRCCEPQREDSFDQFGKYIATLLRNLPSRRTACKLQKEMINWVLKEQMLFEDWSLTWCSLCMKIFNNCNKLAFKNYV